jgi:hypothetical protein
MEEQLARVLVMIFIGGVQAQTALLNFMHVSLNGNAAAHFTVCTPFKLVSHRLSSRLFDNKVKLPLGFHRLIPAVTPWSGQ